MRAKSIILIMIALGCGLVASIGISQHMERGAKSGAGANETEKIFVAMAPIDIGVALTAENVKLEEWPKDKVPQGAIQTLEGLKDRYPRQRLYVGEPILEAKLMDNNEADSTKIPAGYRVAAVSVTMEASVAGLVQPGDRVDLVVFLRRNTEVRQTGVKTILRDVRVFAVNQETERSLDKDGQPIIAKTVSLLVTPQQVERLMLAAQLGNLQLSLRRPNDEEDLDAMPRGITVEQLLGDEHLAERQPVPTPQSENSGGGLLDWLAEQQRQSPNGGEALAVGEPAWKMIMYTPDGTRQFQWQSESSLPEEIGSSTSSAPAAPAPAAAEEGLIGQPLALAGKTAAGDQLQWSVYRGKPVLVHFWASWCEACQPEMEEVTRVYEEYKDHGLSLIGVNLDKDPDTLEKFLSSNPQPGPTLVGADAQQIAARYGITNLPTTILLNRLGEVVAVESSAATLSGQIAQLTGEGGELFDE